MQDHNIFGNCILQTAVIASAFWKALCRPSIILRYITSIAEKALNNLMSVIVMFSTLCINDFYM
jgi:predicted membrane-bound spermidine synthase